MELTESAIVAQQQIWTAERAKLLEQIRTYDGALQAAEFFLAKLKEVPADVPAEPVTEKS